VCGTDKLGIRNVRRMLVMLCLDAMSLLTLKFGWCGYHESIEWVLMLYTTTSELERSFLQCHREVDL
jgi:hypothetical protein